MEHLREAILAMRNLIGSQGDELEIQAEVIRRLTKDNQTLVEENVKLRTRAGSPLTIYPRPDWLCAVIVAGGPSFSDSQAKEVIVARALGKCRVIVVNDSWRRVPNADLLYACDGKWWKMHHVAAQLGFPGELWTQDVAAAEHYGLSWVKVDPIASGLSVRRDLLHGGGNSGYQAINLAYLFGAKEIVLVGFDYKTSGGKSHWFGEHPPELRTNMPYGTWVLRFRDLAKDLQRLGVKMVNCSPDSALDFVEVSTLTEEFGDV